MDREYSVRRTGKTWGIFRKGILIEGGFFTKEGAFNALNLWLDS